MKRPSPTGLLLLAAVGLAAGAQAQQPAAVPAGQPPLRCAVDGTFAPHAFPKLDGGVQGFQVDLFQEVAKRIAQVLANPGSDQQLEHALDSIGGPLNIDVGDVERLLDRDLRNQLQELRQKVDRFKATSPAAPPRAMVLVDNPNPVTPRIFRRGNPNSPGDEVPRRFLRGRVSCSVLLRGQGVGVGGQSVRQIRTK